MHLIFWGSEWNSYPGVRSSVISTFQWLNNSSYMGIFTQYFDEHGPIGREVDLSSYTDTRVFAPTNITSDAQVRDEVAYSIANRPGWAPAGLEDQFMVLFPPSASVAIPDHLCGWHEWNAELGTTIQGVRHLPEGCAEGFASGEYWKAVPSTAVHEFVETVMNPIPDADLGGLFTGWQYESKRSAIDRCVHGNGIPGNVVEPAPSVLVEKVYDNYLAAATGGATDCVAQDSVPVRYSVATGGVSNVSAGSRSAVLSGSVTPAGYPADYQFIVSGGVVPRLPESPAGVGAGFGPVAVSQTLSGLKSSTTYSFRLASSSVVTESLIKGVRGSIAGNWVQFTTPDWRPTVANQATTNRTLTSATINASVNPNGAATTYRFEYGPTQALGSSTADVAVGSGGSAVAVSQTLSGLKPETSYYFRVRATSADGTSYSPIWAFTTMAHAVSYGSALSGAQVNAPTGMDVDSEGNVWVADRANDKILKLNPKGEVVYSFGQSGTGFGQLKEPVGVAVGPDGLIWVVEAGRARVQQFAIYLNHLIPIREFGSTELAGQMVTNPTDLVLPGDGRIYISDQGTQRVGVFSEKPNPSGRHFEQWIGNPVATPSPTGIDGDLAVGFLAVLDDQARVSIIDLATRTITSAWGASGSGPGQLKSPYGLAVKPNGTILVSDRGNNRVQMFSPWGEHLASFGSPGSSAGQLSGPSGLAVSSRGLFFVSDTANKRIQRWTQPGAPEAVTLSVVRLSAGEATFRAHVSPNGLATTYYFHVQSAQGYDAMLPAAGFSAGSDFQSTIGTYTHTSLNFSYLHSVRVVATNSEGTTYGKAITFMPNPTYAYQSTFGSLGSGPTQFSRPIAVAKSPPGWVWVADRLNNRVTCFLNGSPCGTLGTKGSAPGQMIEPTAVAIDAQGDIWVAEDGNDRIQEFSWQTGALLSTIGPIDGNQIRLKTPSGLAFDGDGFLYVADQGKANVQKYNPAAPVGNRFVTSAAVPLAPGQITTDLDGDVWFTEVALGRIYQWRRGQALPEEEFMRNNKLPYGIAVNSEGNILISLFGTNLIEMVTPSGKKITSFGGGPGSGPGQFKEPSGLAVVGDRLYVTDAGNNRVQIWKAE